MRGGLSLHGSRRRITGIRAVLFVAGSALTLALRVSGQTYQCLPDTATDAQVLFDAVVSIVTGTTAQADSTRAAYNLPAVTASKVSIVTTSSLCAAAGAAYHTAVAAPGTPPVSRTLVVIKIGTTRYVVSDPTETGGSGYNLHAVFDKTWHFLVGFAS